MSQNTSNKFYFTFSALAFTLLLSLIGCNNTMNEATPKPNIVLIFADDLGYGDLGCYGHPTIKTPHLDQMAKNGMRFTQFYAGASVCTPSRAALLTGRLPVRYGLANTRMRVFFPWSLSGLPQSETTIAEVLKGEGYNTAIYGKWHLGHQKDYLPTRQGFDEYYGIPYSNDMSPKQTDWKGASLFPPTPIMENEEVVETGPDQSKLTKAYTDRSVAFIKKNRENPFFLYLPHTFPHTPLYASDDFEGTSRRGLYGDVVEEVDWSVGQILKTLEEEGLEENTLVIFTSDNGPWLTENEEGGSAGLLYQGKGSTFEGGMREPMIAQWKGKINPNSVSYDLATTMDLFKTIASVSGVVVNGDDGEDGYDISPILFENKEGEREEVFYYLGEQLFAYRKGAFKIHYKTLNPYIGEQPQIQDPPLLYNLEIDPSEKYNLASAMPEKIEELNVLVDRHKEGVINVETVMMEVDTVMIAPVFED